MSEGKEKGGKILLIIGSLLIVIALTADVIGIGVRPGFGWKQGLLLVAGLGLAWMGKKGCGCCSKEPSDSKDSTPPSTQV